jgi:hypothetical protein
LLELYERERRARAGGVASRGETGAGRERQRSSRREPALGGRSRPSSRWRRRRGCVRWARRACASSSPSNRALSADLARLRTAAGGRAVDELFYLGRLVAGAHNLLYRDRGMPLRAAVRYLFTEGPREVRRSAGPIALAALLLFGRRSIAGVSVARTPSLAPELLPPRCSSAPRTACGARRPARATSTTRSSSAP